MITRWISSIKSDTRAVRPYILEVRNALSVDSRGNCEWSLRGRVDGVNRRPTEAVGWLCWWGSGRVIAVYIPRNALPGLG